MLMNAVKVIYVLAITAFVIMFVAFGIHAFYPEPKPPEFPKTINFEPKPPAIPSPGATPLPEDVRRQEQSRQGQEEYDTAYQAYQEAREVYYRNVFFIAYPFGLLFVFLGLALKRRLDIITPGFILGGLGTIIFALAQPELSNQVRFLGVAVGLALLVYLGYRTLINRKPAMPAEGTN